MARIRKSLDSQRLLPLNPKVYVENRQRALPIEKRAISKKIKEVLSFLNISFEEISVYFVSEKQISELHAQFFNDPTPTDCISFPLDEKHLGEIFVCPAVAVEYAKKHNLDPVQETLLYVIHGILHLLGYDDLTPKDKKVMRRMEKKCLDHLVRQPLLKIK